MYKQHQDNIGFFIEKEFKHEFTYRRTTDEWALKNGFLHELDCGFDQVRFCNVRKTRVYVCNGEDDYGYLIISTWVISKHVIY
jgi:hypothetical protein